MLLHVIILYVKTQKENLESTSGITKFVEINIDITQSTCNLKCTLTIYIYYTKEKK